MPWSSSWRTAPCGVHLDRAVIRPAPEISELRGEPISNKMNVTNDFSNLQRKVEVYKEILKNTEIYRQRWRDGLKTEIREHLTEIAAATGLQGQIDRRRTGQSRRGHLQPGDCESGCPMKWRKISGAT